MLRINLYRVYGCRLEFLVIAQNQREAISKVWNSHIVNLNENRGHWDAYLKKDFYATRVKLSDFSEGVIRVR